MSENIDTTANAGEQNAEAEFRAPASQEELDRIVQKRLERERRKHEDEANELETLRARAAKLDELEEAQKTAEQKREEELTALRAKLAEAEQSVAAKDRAILVERVAASKGVPARYLLGDSEEELVASADQFLEDAKTLHKPVGYVPSQGEGEPTPPASSLDDVRERAKKFARK